MTIEEFANIYDEWRHLRDWTLGPVLRPDIQKDPKRFFELTEVLVSQSDLDQLRDTEEVKFFAKSAWHASFFLEVVHSTFVSRSLGNMLFRGQADLSWAIVPTIDREDLSTFTGAKKLFESLAFRELAANLHTDLTMIGPKVPENGILLSLPREAYVPVAQHYGLITELVDFTADPSVAVFFAANSRATSEGQHARVAASHLGPKNQMFDKIHLKLVPPFFKRPYLQKGVFIQSMKPSDVHEEYAPDLTIDFPAKTIEREFRVIRGEVLNILPEDENIDKIVELSKTSFLKFIENNKFTKFDQREVQDFIWAFTQKVDDDVKPLYKPEVHKAMGYLAEFVEELEDLFYWLCYYTGPGPNGGIELNVGAFDTIIEHNPEIMLMFAKMYRFLLSNDSFSGVQDERRKKWQGTLSDHIYERLEKSGHNPHRKITAEDFVR